MILILRITQMKFFFMFSGEKSRGFTCDNSLMKTMVDRFGEDVTTLAQSYDASGTDRASASLPFRLGIWLQWQVQILAPESVKEQYRDTIAS